MPEGTIQDSRNPNSPQWGYLEVDEHDQQEPTNPGQWPPIYDKDWNEFVMFMHNKQSGGGTELWEKDTKVEFEFLKAKISVHSEDNPDKDNLPKKLNRNIWIAVLTRKIEK